MHLRDEDIAALIIPGRENAAGIAAREHVAECPRCADTLRMAQDADRAAGDLLSLLDHPAPKISIGALLARRRRTASPYQKLAAGIAIFLVTATAAFALPGSPLPQMLRELVARYSSEPGPLKDVPLHPRSGLHAAEPGALPSSIAIVPDTLLEIAFRHRQTAGSIRIGFTDAASAAVTSSGTAPSFDVQANRIAVENLKSDADFGISLPRTLARAVVSVDGVVVFKSDHGSTVPSGTRTAAGLVIVVPFVPERSGSR